MAYGDDWGNGILMSMDEYRVVMDFDEAFGLRELHHKVNARAGYTKNTINARFSIDAELCYGTNSVEIVRRYLDTGVLQVYVQKNFSHDGCWTADTAFRFIVLGACLMSLGCTLPAGMRAELEQMQKPAYRKVTSQANPGSPLAKMKPLATTQLKAALENYQDGIPYSYGNQPFLEAMMLMQLRGKSAKTTVVGSMRRVEVTLSNGMVIPGVVGPPNDEEVGLKPSHPYHICGGCGAKEAPDKKLQVCSSCKERKYCSKECQKKHWKKHKIICAALKKEKMEQFLAEIPSILVDKDVDVSAVLSDVPEDQKVAVISGSISNQSYGKNVHF